MGCSTLPCNPSTCPRPTRPSCRRPCRARGCSKPRRATRPPRSGCRPAYRTRRGYPRACCWWPPGQKLLWPSAVRPLPISSLFPCRAPRRPSGGFLAALVSFWCPVEGLRGVWTSENLLRAKFAGTLPSVPVWILYGFGSPEPPPLPPSATLRLSPARGEDQRSKPSKNTQSSYAQDRPAPRCSRRARGEASTQNRSGRQVGTNRHRGSRQETARRVKLSRRLPGRRANTTGVPGKFSRAARIMTDAARPNAA